MYKVEWFGSVGFDNVQLERPARDSCLDLVRCGKLLRVDNMVVSVQIDDEQVNQAWQGEPGGSVT